MAIILISNNEDISTNRIVEWLQYFRKDFVRTSFDDYARHRIFSLSLSNAEDVLCFSISDNQTNIEAVWYRLDVSQISIPENADSSFIKTLRSSLVDEVQYLRRSLFVQNGSCKWLSNYESTLLNKVTVLREAKKD